ncbi:phosphotransferase family protein [Arsenicicoccus dermatophilus]|uniref:phosphotransferase family protein n=1 Tax=Arsenicicoccus dermatophilus TaxID=1076331 RepID=UPI0039173F08
MTARLDRLDDLARLGLAATWGSSLGHGDLRADNLLVQPDGTVRIVDWPHASRGAPWCDGVSLAVDVAQHGGLVGGADVLAVLEPWALGLGATSDQVTGFLAGMAAYYADAARHPAVPGLPTPRVHQGQARDAAMLLLRSRLA